MYKSLIIILGLLAVMVQIPAFAQASNDILAKSKTENILNKIFDTNRNDYNYNYNRNDDYRRYNNDRQNQNQRKRNNQNRNRNRSRNTR